MGPTQEIFLPRSSWDLNAGVLTKNTLPGPVENLLQKNQIRLREKEEKEMAVAKNRLKKFIGQWTEKNESGCLPSNSVFENGEVKLRRCYNCFEYKEITEANFYRIGKRQPPLRGCDFNSLCRDCNTEVKAPYQQRTRRNKYE